MAFLAADYGGGGEATVPTMRGWTQLFDGCVRAPSALVRDADPQRTAARRAGAPRPARACRPTALSEPGPYVFASA